jgi:hypothetical protein
MLIVYKVIFLKELFSKCGPLFSFFVFDRVDFVGKRVKETPNPAKRGSMANSKPKSTHAHAEHNIETTQKTEDTASR